MKALRACEIIVVGGANTDLIARARQLPEAGQNAAAEEFAVSPGGKGVNQAVAAARLGHSVALIACLGQDDRGEELLDHLRCAGVNTQHGRRTEGAATGAVLKTIVDPQHMLVTVFSGANALLRRDDILACRELIQGAVVLNVQLEVPLACVRAAIELAAEAGTKVILDPDPARDLPNDLLQLVDVIKPNSHEAEVLTRRKVSDRESARAAADRLLERGVRAVAIEGGSGNLLVWDQGECWLPHLPVFAREKTGAGDAFAAALAAGLVEQRSWPEIGALASAAAALTTTQLGTWEALPRREQVEQMLQQHRATIVQQVPATG